MTPVLTLSCHDAHLEVARAHTASKTYGPHARAIAAYDGPTDDLESSLLAIFVLDEPNREERRATFHFAGIDGRWANRTLLRMVADLVSKRMGIDTLDAPIDIRNDKAIKAALQAGFTLRGVISPNATMPQGGNWLSLALSNCALIAPEETEQADPNG